MVTFICSLKVAPLHGKELATEADLKKMKCLYQRAMTCGIKNEITPCEGLERRIDELFVVSDATLDDLKTFKKIEAERFLKTYRELAVNATRKCSMALGLEGVNGKCRSFCGNEEQPQKYDIEKELSIATDWRDAKTTIALQFGED